MWPLFLDKHYPQSRGTKIRPLGIISDFAMESLPRVLEDIREKRVSVGDLEYPVGVLISSISQHCDVEAVKANPRQLDIALLDLKMLECGIVHSQGIVPDNLITLTDYLARASDQIPGLTYEDLILINPVSDRRLFTQGEVGGSEEDFYEVHRRIELKMDHVTAGLWRSIQVLQANGLSGVDAAIESISEVLTIFREVLPLMDAVGLGMKPDHFAVFRIYLNPPPHRKLNGEPMRGPSGAFSATFPETDLLLGGEKVAKDHLDFITDCMLYYPRRGREEIQQALTNTSAGLALNSLSARVGNPPELTEKLLELNQLLRKFRGRHYRGVENQIPAALTGKLPGTGGVQDTNDFLKMRIKADYISSKD